ncbi:MAG: ExbD/TolR family protein [Candidatus Methylacidiphilales bacterium]|nr:biopolymer transporter ExbD [Candidatus Methylacidiphilales bacterium]
MKRFSDKSGYSTMSELNVTPLLDLAFVLLIIFIITTPLLEQSLNVQLPVASPAPLTSTDAGGATRSVRTLEVDAQGQIVFDKQRMSLAQLRPALEKFRTEDPNAGVLIRADKDLRYQQLVDVFDAVQLAKIPRMGLLNNPRPGIP